MKTIEFTLQPVISRFITEQLTKSDYGTRKGVYREAGNPRRYPGGTFGNKGTQGKWKRRYNTSAANR